MIATAQHILIINGSLRGTTGNSYAVAKQAKQLLENNLQQKASLLTLTDALPTVKEVYELIAGCDGMLPKIVTIAVAVLALP